MGEVIILAGNILLDQMILAIVVKNDVHFPVAWAANVGAEHDLVGSFAVEVLLINIGRGNLDVSTATIDALFVFHGELDDQWFAAVREFVELGREGIESSILRSLDALITSLVAVPFARGGHEFTEIILMFGLDPAGFPGIIKFLFKIDFGQTGAYQE